MCLVLYTAVKLCIKLCANWNFSIILHKKQKKRILSFCNMFTMLSSTQTLHYTLHIEVRVKCCMCDTVLKSRKCCMCDTDLKSRECCVCDTDLKSRKCCMCDTVLKSRECCVCDTDLKSRECCMCDTDLKSWSRNSVKYQATVMVWNRM